MKRWCIVAVLMMGVPSMVVAQNQADPGIWFRVGEAEYGPGNMWLAQIKSVSGFPDGMNWSEVFSPAYPSSSTVAQQPYEVPYHRLYGNKVEMWVRYRAATITGSGEGWGEFSFEQDEDDTFELITLRFYRTTIGWIRMSMYGFGGSCVAYIPLHAPSAHLFALPIWEGDDGLDYWWDNYYFNDASAGDIQSRMFGPYLALFGQAAIHFNGNYADLPLTDDHGFTVPPNVDEEDVAVSEIPPNTYTFMGTTTIAPGDYPPNTGARAQWFGVYVRALTFTGSGDTVTWGPTLSNPGEIVASSYTVGGPAVWNFEWYTEEGGPGYWLKQAVDAFCLSMAGLHAFARILRETEK